MQLESIVHLMPVGMTTCYSNRRQSTCWFWLRLIRRLMLTRSLRPRRHIPNWCWSVIGRSGGWRSVRLVSCWGRGLGRSDRSIWLSLAITCLSQICVTISACLCIGIRIVLICIGIWLAVNRYNWLVLVDGWLLITRCMLLVAGQRLWGLLWVDCARIILRCTGWPMTLKTQTLAFKHTVQQNYSVVFVDQLKTSQIRTAKGFIHSCRTSRVASGSSNLTQDYVDGFKFFSSEVLIILEENLKNTAIFINKWHKLSKF